MVPKEAAERVIFPLRNEDLNISSLSIKEGKRDEGE
jgi:hypothetical protein